MKLSTEVPFLTTGPKVGYKETSVLMGSCFSEHIGQWLRAFQFDARANLTGISYNPASIAKHITMALDQQAPKLDEYIDAGGRWVHTDFHSSLVRSSAHEASEAIQASLTLLNEGLRAASLLFITFGTAVAFQKKGNGEIVNNCHKLPAHGFDQVMPEESIYEGLISGALHNLKSENPKVQIYLTVSPVRHLRHGAAVNQRSKARLIRLCEKLECSSDWIHYLPVYEMVMDELRDYRFYRHDDLLHLNEAGLAIIQEKLKSSVIADEALPLMEKIRQWHAMRKHRILHPDTEQASSFLAKLRAHQEDLEELLGRPLLT